MAMGKSILFIAGALAGGALMFALQGKNQAKPEWQTTADSELTDDAAVGVVSPFAATTQPEPTITPPEVQTVETQTAQAADDTSELVARLAEAELRISELEVTVAELTEDRPQPPQDESDTTDLLLSGFEPATIEEIKTIRNQAQLERLELRDLATREGWINTDRFRQERQQLNRNTKLRETLGDDNYDRLLLAEGRDNRVRIESVIANSAADTAGIESGDIILRYSDERIFSFRDLQAATTSGQRDQTVTIQVIRDSEIVDLVIPRGPMGVNLRSTTDDPDS